ncbi:ChaN family lipoprotein [Vibrio sp. ZOR0018]|uniref:ChaN family lipoprotein n=1 Tax=Vibrio sp. ZOR0018 TaxID=1339225 RepID=UPI0006484AFA|nr:ChaN family lipoprotein [Vibrio sp. ZOR0018]
METLMRLVTSLALLLPLFGCASHQPKPIAHFYDYQLSTPSGKPLNLNSLPNEIKNADIILVGEWHTHPAIHRFQTELLAQLSRENTHVALSMEQFSRDEQEILNRYLAGEIGEQYLISQTRAWPNYQSDYRPLVEFAKSQQLDVIAANAPKPFVRCIGKVGIKYLDKLTPVERAQVAHQIDTSASPYKAKFMESMHHGSKEQTEKQYAAQLTWDETMAESMVDYLQNHPTAQVMHIAGKFHTEQGLGTAHSILRRNPDLKIAIITPVEDTQTSYPDFQLTVLPIPTAYVQAEHRMQAYQQIKNRNTDLTCD